jgi:hypothetical protein
VSGTSLSPQLAHLLDAQNADGGWGYFPGKQSWLEPTAYAFLALSSSAEAEKACERAWQLVRSWQLPSGGWRPCAQVADEHWTTALAIIMHCRRRCFDEPFLRGVDRLLQICGAEGTLIQRFAHWLRPENNESDPRLQGWPWRPDTSSWVEPTAHTLVALRRAQAGYARLPGAKAKLLQDRIRMGEQMLLDRRCRDGGWNYGNRRVLRTDLPSYPETTALALLGLRGSPVTKDLENSLRRAERFLQEAPGPLARAWLTLCLREYGRPAPTLERITKGDTLIQAVAALHAYTAPPEGKT